MTQQTSYRGRRAVIQALKESGPARADEIAAGLGVTPMAVRQHLYALEGEGIVTHAAEAEGRGRPAKRWALTEAADRFFPDGHGELVAGLLGEVRQVLGAQALESLIAHRTAAQVESYRARIGAGPLRRRLEALAEIRSEEGYMAAVEQTEDGYLLIENHCPICTAAKACSGLCAAELDCFRAVLGEGVRVERSDHILAGARRCAYRVVESSSST